jgi:hypothetical protein
LNEASAGAAIRTNDEGQREKQQADVKISARQGPKKRFKDWAKDDVTHKE